MFIKSFCHYPIFQVPANRKDGFYKQISPFSIAKFKSKIRLKNVAASMPGMPTSYEKPEVLDTLAAAYAATGRFRQAVEIAEKALKLAQSSKQQEVIEQIRNHLRLYKVGKPCIEPSPKAFPD